MSAGAPSQRSRTGVCLSGFLFARTPGMGAAIRVSN